MSFRISRTLLVAMLIALSVGCASTTSSSKGDEKNPFADYPVTDILEAGDKALEAGETERAVYIYMQALEIEQTPETWYRIGLGKARLGDKGYARKAFDKAIELDADHVGAHEELGLTYMAIAQPEQAKFHLEKATTLDATRWRAWNALGVLADMDKQYAAAVEYYHAGLIAAPQSPILMTNIGYSYYLSGDMEQAASWFGRALIAEDNYPPAVKNLALLYARQGWYDEAVKTFSRVVSKPQAYNDVGYIAMRDGDYEDAFELLTEAIRLSPTYYKKAYENLEIVRKEMAVEGKVSPAEAALNSSSDRIVVVDGQAPRKATVTAELLNVRSAPESDADIVTHLKAGEKVEVIMTKPGWAYVNYRPSANDGNLTGWVNSRYVGNSAETSTLIAEPAAPAEAETSADSTEQPAADAPIVNADPVPTGAAQPNSGGTAPIELAVTFAVPDESNVTATALPDADANLTAMEIAVASLAADADPATPGAAALPEASPSADTSTGNIDQVTRKLAAVCEPGIQAEKTPQGAGSCIGVASFSADE